MSGASGSAAAGSGAGDAGVGCADEGSEGDGAVVSCVSLDPIHHSKIGVDPKRSSAPSLVRTVHAAMTAPSAASDATSIPIATPIRRPSSCAYDGGSGRSDTTEYAPVHQLCTRSRGRMRTAASGGAVEGCGVRGEPAEDSPPRSVSSRNRASSDAALAPPACARLACIDGRSAGRTAAGHTAAARAAAGRAATGKAAIESRCYARFASGRLCALPPGKGGHATSLVVQGWSVQAGALARGGGGGGAPLLLLSQRSCP